jgi:hypothetical protein
MSNVSRDRTPTPPKPPGEERPPFQPDLNLITLLEGSGRKDPKEIWLRKYGPDAKKPFWKRLVQALRF